MGIDWTNRDELAEAIPPAYTEFVGKQLLDHLATSNSPLDGHEYVGQQPEEAMAS
jgi:hypothetical protein